MIGRESTPTISEAKEMILDGLEEKVEADRKPVIKLKKIYKTRRSWSPVLFKAAHSLEEERDDIQVVLKSGYHYVELEE